MNLVPLFSPPSWRRSCFLSTETSRLDRAPGFTMSWFMVSLFSGLPRGSRLQQRKKNSFFSFFFHFYPETPPSSCSAPFILVKCNSVLDTCAHHIIMSTLVCGEAFWVCRAQRGHGDSSAPLLLGCENVPPDVWTHPLGALNPFPDGEARGV